MSIFSDGNRLTPEAVDQLLTHADMIQCQCPVKLIEILRTVRAFANYTGSCIDTYPADAKMHRWLLQSAENLDTLISSTIAQLARYEGFINEANEFTARNKF